jgi:hypothetical protein
MSKKRPRFNIEPEGNPTKESTKCNCVIRALFGYQDEDTSKQRTDPRYNFTHRNNYSKGKR